MTLRAILRYRERVQALATPGDVVAALTAIAIAGRRRPHPRRWMRGTRVYAGSAPGVCLVMREGAVLTVLSRASCRAWQRNHVVALEHEGGRREFSRRRRDWVDFEEAA